MNKRLGQYRDRGDRVKGSKVAAGTAIATIGLAVWAAVPEEAFAAGRMDSPATVKVGTLPLLAALAVGIAIAVGAVIAFLQMTARDKGMQAFSSQSRAERDPDSDPDEDDGIDFEEWTDEETAPNPEYEEPITDYTIPVTRLLEQTGPAEAAEVDEPRLCGVAGEHAGSRYRLTGRRLTIGRDPARCAVLYPYEFADISRVHCTVRYDDARGIFLLEDNGSSNGTFLDNGERLKPGAKVELRSGERFALSDQSQTFEVKD
ncbi:FHA domain-containing protein [Cohnella suwonensis]|uniref:FHA domain-containing protein n=1 Tax=Cohnella suwonensis TaxID=696072 RepID=A0ABW0LYV0_9BACL